MNNKKGITKHADEIPCGSPKKALINFLASPKKYHKNLKIFVKKFLLILCKVLKKTLSNPEKSEKSDWV